MPIPAEQLEEVRFSTALRGFDRDEVLAFVRRLAAYNRAAAQEVAELRQQLAAGAAPPGGAQQDAAQLAEVVALAEQAIDEVLAEHRRVVADLEQRLEAERARADAAEAAAARRAAAAMTDHPSLARPAGTDLEVEDEGVEDGGEDDEELHAGAPSLVPTVIDLVPRRHDEAPLRARLMAAQSDNGQLLERVRGTAGTEA